MCNHLVVANQNWSSSVFDVAVCHCGLLSPYGVMAPCHHCSRKRLVACSLPSNHWFSANWFSIGTPSNIISFQLQTLSFKKMHFHVSPTNCPLFVNALGRSSETFLHPVCVYWRGKQNHVLIYILDHILFGIESHKIYTEHSINSVEPCPRPLQ